MQFAELSNNYIQELAKQIIFVSSFLGGFSATILGTLILANKNSKVLEGLIISVSLAAVSFILAVMAMTKIVLSSIPGSPVGGETISLILPRTVGSIAFIIGILALLFTISLSGWLQSKKLGIITSIIGFLGFVLVIWSS